MKAPVGLGPLQHTDILVLNHLMLVCIDLNSVTSHDLYAIILKWPFLKEECMDCHHPQLQNRCGLAAQDICPWAQYSGRTPTDFK